MTPSLWVRCLLLASAASVLINNVPAQGTGMLVITDVTVIDVARGRAVPNSTVALAGGRIATVDADRAQPSAAAVTVFDADGRFLIPGLWDMHAHHEMTGEESLELYVINGVTGTRDMGGALDLILAMRQSTAAGEVLGPKIAAAGPILDAAPEGWPLRYRVRTADEAKDAVRMLKRRGVDFFKVHDNTPREAYFAIAEEAERQGLPFAGHVPREITFDEAIEAGQSSIEHIAGLRLYTQCSGGNEYNAERCEDFFRTLARRGVWQTPTLWSWRNLMSAGRAESAIGSDELAYASPPLRAMWAGNQQASNVTPEMIKALVAASETAAVVTNDLQTAGVGILAGCDGMVPGFCVHAELAMMVRGGMSPLAALQTATINPARYLRLEQSLGTVEAGKLADLVLLDGNPLDDIANVGRIRAVVVQGRLLDRPELDARLAALRERFGEATR